jgi:hypothetical protein
MSTWIRKVVTATAAILALALLLPAPASAQSPANCNANLLDESISRSTDTAMAGQIVTYLGTATDRTKNPAGCSTDPLDPAFDPNCQVGCDVLDLTADFCCPGPTGNPPMPPDPLCTNIVTNRNVPAQDATVSFGICSGGTVVCRFTGLPGDCPVGETCGQFPCTMPNIVGIATAGVFGTGFLDDGHRSPFTIDKTIAVEIVTTTTTTTTSTTTSTTSTTTTTSSTTTTTTTTTTTSTTSTTTTTTSTTSTTTTLPTQVDYSCYQIPHKNSVKPPIVVTLEDRFGTTTVTSASFHELCAPTNKNDDNPGADTLPGHLLAFPITKTTDALTLPKGLSIDYQFGTLTADLGAQSLLMVPAGKSLTAPAPAPPADIRHYQCYKLTNVGGDRTAKGVSVVDQFTAPNGITVDVSKRGPWRLCVPVSKNGEAPDAVADRNDLLCNATANDALPFGEFDAFVGTQFFASRKVIGTQYDLLCMPASTTP